MNTLVFAGSRDYDADHERYLFFDCPNEPQILIQNGHHYCIYSVLFFRTCRKPSALNVWILLYEALLLPLSSYNDDHLPLQQQFNEDWSHAPENDWSDRNSFPGLWLIHCDEYYCEGINGIYQKVFLPYQRSLQLFGCLISSQKLQL